MSTPLLAAFERDPFHPKGPLLPEVHSSLKNDGFENEITGLGTYSRDKAMHVRFERAEPLVMNWPLLSALYHDDDISGRIIDILPDNMFRVGWDLKVADDKSREKAKLFEADAKRLFVHARLKKGTAMGRLYGGALALIGVDDNRPWDQPLDEENIKTIAYINVIDRRFVIVDSWYGDPLAPNHGQPMTYRLYNQLIDPKTTPPNRDMVVVHESRLIRFEGANTDDLERRILAGWTHSSLQRPYEKVKAFVQAFQAAGNLMTDASQGVYKLDGLMGQISGNEVEAIQTRMMMLDLTRSVARAIVLDKDGEEFERKVVAISGYPEMLDRFMMLLSAATEIPVTLLMGRSAAGMNATGDSDFRQFYSIVKNLQTHVLEPQLQRIFKLMSLAKDGPTDGEECEFTFKFRSLWEPTLLEQAQINFTQAQADSLYVTMGAATGEEIAISRFGDGDINLSTTVDMEARQEAQEAGEMFDAYPNEPDPVPGATPGGQPLKGQGAIAPAPPPAQGTKVASKAPTGSIGRAPRKPNSSQPGGKSGAGR